MTRGLPTLTELGRDLLHVAAWRLAVSLTLPFLLAGSFCLFALTGWWLLAGGSMVALSFFTYGSISHDLVHRSLGLPRRLNDVLLTLIELLMLRSGCAYRLAHLNHHARYPDPANDPEGRAAHGSFWAAVRSGPFFFARIWSWAFLTFPRQRARLLAEGGVVVGVAAAAILVAIAGWSMVPLVYVSLAYLGTWVVPVVTGYIPHSPGEQGELRQTRRFRGWIARLIALDHLYHLEHHLYPAVPHHRWPELANRLDPFLDRARVPIIRLGV